MLVLSHPQVMPLTDCGIPSRPESAASPIVWAGMTWSITPATFVPRASSIEFLSFVRSLRPRARTLIDLCCGSGALGIALHVGEPDAFREVVLLDASADAVRSAETNRRRYAVPGFAQRWSAGDPLPARADAFIICSPPFLEPASVVDLPEWQQLCEAADDGGLAVARACFRSITLSAPRSRVALKCLRTQLPQLA